MQIREGAYYRRRDGNVVGPTKKITHKLYPWAIDDETYSPDGGYTDEPSHLDLVAEVFVSESATPDVRVFVSESATPDVRAVGAALLTNRGTHPSSNGRYLCYVKRPGNPRVKPMVLSRHNDRWFGDNYNEDRIVVTWCGPIPAIENMKP